MRQLTVLFILLSLFVPGRTQAQVAEIILDAPSTIPSAAMADGVCPADKFDVADPEAPTNVADATAALNAWLNTEYARIRATDTTSTIVFKFPANTCYRLDGTQTGGLVIKDKVNIRLEGDSTIVEDANGDPLPSNNDDLFGVPVTALPNRDDNGNPYPHIKVTTVFKVIRQLTLAEVSDRCANVIGEWNHQANCFSRRRHVWIQGGSDITLRGLRVEGENLTYDNAGPTVPVTAYGGYKTYWEFEHGFDVHGGSNITLENLQVRGVWGDGISTQNNVQGLTVKNFRVSFNGRQGLTLGWAENVLLENIQILNSRRSGFDLEPAAETWWVRNVLIKNSYTMQTGTAVAGLGRGPVDNIEIRNNVLDGAGGSIIVFESKGQRRYDWRVYDNVRVWPYGSPLAAVRFTNVTNVDIQRNKFTVDLRQSRNPLSLIGVDGTVIIKDNDLRSGCWVYTGDISNATTVVEENNLLAAPETCAGKIAPTPIPTWVVTPWATATATFVPSPVATGTPTPTPTVAATVAPTVAATATLSPTLTPAPTATLSPLADNIRDALEEYPDVLQELKNAGVID